MSGERSPYFPVQALTSIETVDSEALRVQKARQCGLGVFTAVFHLDLDRVLLCRLGDYVKKIYNGNPWTLPGGAVESDERPSEAAAREVLEETGIEVAADRLQCAAWLHRPYFRPRQQEYKGEIILVFATVVENIEKGTLNPRPSPPEVVDARFCEFSLEHWLQVPTRGTGEHRLQPLPRHWAYWTHLAWTRLDQKQASAAEWTYAASADMARPPW